ncbi:peptide deformylase [Thalassotalea marina]|uniref:Peptide deformylase n=1 Tax=Thalassotalea marina TaxID=1673741 RepID=A0A919ENT6_9GAMM|nr:peptide deformylase [Thalassotalea marina]GHG02854.1 peptide deformylase 2 [Thalassotalea marina]
MTSKIAQLGHPILKTKAKSVSFPLTKEDKNDIAHLLTQVAQSKGVGIAATQLYINKRIFIMCSKPNERYPDAPDMEPLVLINPEIVAMRGEPIKGWEGCLSVPAIRGLVPRSPTIDVQFFDIAGECHHITYYGFLARIFQHELDHLEGKTFVDRVESTADLMSETEWYRQHVN